MSDVVEYPLKAIERITMERNRLAAEVERLSALLAAARVAVEKWPTTMHSQHCCGWNAAEGDEPDRIVNCDCHAWKIDKARTEARRAVGLEGSHG